LFSSYYIIINKIVFIILILQFFSISFMLKSGQNAVFLEQTEVFLG
jgi:hypothetical protein